MNFLDRVKFLFRFNTKSYKLSELLPSWYSGRPVWTDWSTKRAIKYGFKSSTWVYACIYKIMKAVASVPWKVRDANTKEDIENSPLEELLRKPNPWMSGQNLFERLVTHLYLGGNGIWGKVRVNRIVVELWPYHPDSIRPVPSRTEFILKYT
ncbi:MAG: phage portal protein, partial [Candidatus Heimdallarchaeaceae archaeon]